MTISQKRIKNPGEIKQNVKNIHVCPSCKEKIEIGIEAETLNKLLKKDHFPYPHIHLHGYPLHAMLCYIDKNLTIRNVGAIKSIEISRDSETFSQIVRKWSNPY
jgi:hypothetical protein